MEDGNGAATRRNTRCRPRAPRVLCGKEMMETCVSNRWLSTLSTLSAANIGVPGQDRIAQSNAPCAGPSSRQGGYADVERHVPELYDWVRNDNDAAPKVRSAIFDVVSWFPGVPAAALDRRQRAMPARRTLQLKCVETRDDSGSRGYGTAVRAFVFETYGRLGGEGTKQLRDLVTTAAANGQCSPHAVGRWRTQLERVVLTAHADTYLRALGPRAAERPAAEHPLRLAE